MLFIFMNIVPSDRTQTHMMKSNPPRLSLFTPAAAVETYQISFGSDGVSISTAANDNKQAASPTSNSPLSPAIPPPPSGLPTIAK